MSTPRQTRRKAAPLLHVPCIAVRHPTHAECEQFARAQLRASEGLLLRVHFEICPVCRARTRAIAGRLRTETHEAVAADYLPAGRHNALLPHRLAVWQVADPRGPGCSGRLAHEPDAFAELPWRVPAVVRALLADRDASLPWHTVAPGVGALPLPVPTDGAIVQLFRIAPGVTAPLHHHQHGETMQVLHGGFEDHLGIHHAGAYLQYPADGAAHVATALHTHGPCVALSRSLSVAPTS